MTDDDDDLEQRLSAKWGLGSRPKPKPAALPQERQVEIETVVENGRQPRRWLMYAVENGQRKLKRTYSASVTLDEDVQRLEKSGVKVNWLRSQP